MRQKRGDKNVNVDVDAGSDAAHILLFLFYFFYSFAVANFLLLFVALPKFCTIFFFHCVFFFGFLLCDIIGETHARTLVGNTYVCKLLDFGLYKYLYLFNTFGFSLILCGLVALDDFLA